MFRAPLPHSLRGSVGAWFNGIPAKAFRNVQAGFPMPEFCQARTGCRQKLNVAALWILGPFDRASGVPSSLV